MTDDVLCFMFNLMRPGKQKLSVKYTAKLCKSTGTTGSVIKIFLEMKYDYKDHKICIYIQTSSVNWKKISTYQEMVD